MRWTQEKVEELRGFAHLGGCQAAARMGVTYGALRYAARTAGIHLGPPPKTLDDKFRERWVKMLPAMKMALRADIEAQNLAYGAAERS